MERLITGITLAATLALTMAFGLKLLEFNAEQAAKDLMAIQERR
jgi:hypothetical protein